VSIDLVPLSKAGLNTPADMTLQMVNFLSSSAQSTEVDYASLVHSVLTQGAKYRHEVSIIMTWATFMSLNETLARG
jgi:hypothetical protein